ncbi:hypothetical protein [Cohnella boryungensis]|uniref:Uncharacterized protein n=1 Tax=Cohnella boryungensis TaxID=768479 RepID=A0ABV8S7J3_9BACL
MAGEQIEIIINANGVARTEQVFKSVDKYLERIHRRVDKLGRMRVHPMARLNDRVTPQIEKINRLLNRLTGQIRRVTIVPVLKLEAAAKLSAKLEATFKPVLKVKINADINAALKAAATLKAKLTAALKLKLTAVLRVKASLTVFIKGILKGKCPPCKGSGKGKGGSPPGKGKPCPPNLGKSSCPPGKGKGPAGGLGKGKCSPGKDKSRSSGGGRGGKGAKGGKFSFPCPPEKGGRRQRPAKDTRKKMPLPDREQPKGGAKTSKPGGIKPPAAAVSPPKPKGIFGKLADGAKGFFGGKAASGLGKAAKFAGKAIKPLGFLTDAVDIIGAKPGEERNKAIRSAAGGWAGAAAGAATGAAIGSIIPGIGTAIGGFVGGAIGGLGGSKIAENIGNIGKSIGDFGKKIGGLFSWGKKKKKEEEPVALPEPETPSGPQLMPSPAAPFSAPFSAPSGPLNVNLPVGAVQLTVQGMDLNYEELSAIIGSKVADAIRRAMENRD